VDSNLCIECHQGRESTVTVNNYLGDKPVDTPDPKISFRNVHYFAAGATLFGDAAKGAYQYDGQEYVGQNITHPLNKCTDCHDVHALNVKVDACKGCHTNVEDVEDLEAIRFASNTTDWNGNGNVTEGVALEIDGLREALYLAIQAGAEQAGTPILYDAGAYPYWLWTWTRTAAAERRGQWGTTRGRLVAESCLQLPYAAKSVPSPTIQVRLQFLYDSIQDVGGDVAGFTRP
jgi:hypothetical protein